MNKYLCVFPSRLSPRRFVPILTLALAATCPGQIRTATKPDSADYHGTRVVDHYQWLAKSGDPAVGNWTAGQNKAARTYLDKLHAREHLTYDFNKLFSSVSADYSSLTIRSNLVFALKFKPPAQQPVLVTIRSPNDI